MIHHFARALAVREQARSVAAFPSSAQDWPSSSPGGASLAGPRPPSGISRIVPRLSIRRDPADARRTVIAGRFADVCAALDRMAAELEAV